MICYDGVVPRSRRRGRTMRAGRRLDGVHGLLEPVKDSTSHDVEEHAGRVLIVPPLAAAS